MCLFVGGLPSLTVWLCILGAPVMNKPLKTRTNPRCYPHKPGYSCGSKPMYHFGRCATHFNGCSTHGRVFGFCCWLQRESDLLCFLAVWGRGWCNYVEKTTPNKVYRDGFMVLDLTFSLRTPFFFGMGAARQVALTPNNLQHPRWPQRQNSNSKGLTSLRRPWRLHKPLPTALRTSRSLHSHRSSRLNTA